MLKQIPTCYSLMDEAWRLRQSALSVCRGCNLDEKTAMWVIRDDAWRELRRHEDMQGNYLTQMRGGERANRLFGIPVRLTICDEPDVPMIQLVMEPMMSPIKQSRRMPKPND